MATNLNGGLGSFGFGSDDTDDTRPYAYLNYVLFRDDYTVVDAGWRRMPPEAGFDPGEEGLPGLHQRMAFDDPVVAGENGYLYVWVSNESENTQVWFDDLRVSHTGTFVAQATDYGAWGDVLREQRTDERKYRFGYQGQFSERDEETGYNFFQLRNYDPIIGRWISPDPYAQYWSPYNGMGNDPINSSDPDGGYSKFGAWWRSGFSSDIYQSGDTEDGSREVWGFNDSDGVAHFGDDAGSFWKTASALQSQDILNRASQSYTDMLWAQMSPVDRIMARGGDRIEPFNIEVDIALLFTTGGLGNAAKTGLSATSRARGLGIAGESAVGINGSKTAIQVGGRTRIPDLLTRTTLEEVKNVQYQAFTRQLRNFHRYSQDNGLQMILHTSPILFYPALFVKQ